MMKKVAVVCVVAILLMASVSSAASVRFHGSGSWDMLEGVGQAEGWQSATAPDATTNVRANWANNTVTLDYETTVNRFQLGVDEGGGFHILDGGTLHSNGSNKVGNNGSVTGFLNIDAGGTVNANGGWMMIAGNTNVTGVVDVSGILNTEGHLWMATGAGSTATMDVYGTVNVGENIGLGTIAPASAPTGGVATITVHDGGLLNLDHWDNVGTIRDGSSLNIFGSGVVTIGGNRVDAAYAYEDIGKIVGDLGGIWATFDGGANLTTIVTPEPATMLLLGLGGLLIRKRR